VDDTIWRPSSEPAEEKKSKAPTQRAATPEAKKRSATRKKTVGVRRPATNKQQGQHSTGSSAAIVEFGLGVGSGFIGHGRGDRQRYQNQWSGRRVRHGGADLASQAMAARRLEHDPEKWEPVFEKDHAQTKSETMIAIQSDPIVVKVA
jgi:hypothetical protein